jgi:hypothetical protein
MLISKVHTDFRRGQKVFVVMKDGTKFVDKYIEQKSKVIIFENSGRVSLRKIRSNTIFR